MRAAAAGKHVLARSPWRTRWKNAGAWWRLAGKMRASNDAYRKYFGAGERGAEEALLLRESSGGCDNVFDLYEAVDQRSEMATEAAAGWRRIA